MKQRKTSRKEFMVFLSVITMFVFIVSLSSLYVSNLVQRGEVCGCIIPVPIMIVVLSSLGLFVGSLTYYLVFSKFSFEKEKMGTNIRKTLDFLDNDEKGVVQALIKNPNGLSQSRLAKSTGFDKVKTHRIVKRLESRKIIDRFDVGRIRIVKLGEELESIFGKD